MRENSSRVLTEKELLSEADLEDMEGVFCQTMVGKTKPPASFIVDTDWDDNQYFDLPTTRK